MFNDCRKWMIFIFLCGMTINVTAQDFINQPMQIQGHALQEASAMGDEMAPPPPPGPYLVDPDPKSTNIYYDMRETIPYNQQSEPYSGYVEPQYPPGQMSAPYGQQYYYPPPPAPAPGGYYRPYEEAYGNPYPPPYPGYPQSQQQYVNPYGLQQ